MTLRPQKRWLLGAILCFGEKKHLRAHFFLNGIDILTKIVYDMSEESGMLH